MMKLMVLSCALAAATGSLIASWGHPAPLTYTAGLSYATPWFGGSNYRGPLSLAPGQPANIIAADGRPLDTLAVNLDRAAHITAKALSGANVHLVKKRSLLPLIAPVAHSAALAYSAFHTYAAPFLTPFQTFAAPLLSPLKYRGLLSLAPYQPTSILDDDDTPFDALDANLNHPIHFTAKTLTGVGTHILSRALSFK